MAKEGPAPASAPMAPIRSGHFMCDNLCGYGGTYPEVEAHEQTCEIDEHTSPRTRAAAQARHATEYEAAQRGNKVDPTWTRRANQRIKAVCEDCHVEAAVCDRAANSRGPGCPTGTPWHPLADPLGPFQMGKRHRKHSRASARTFGCTVRPAAAH